MVIDRNSWHARWYLLSRRAWCRFRAKPLPHDEQDTDLCRYVRFSALAVPTIVAAHLLAAASTVGVVWAFLESYGVDALGRGAMGIAGVLGAPIAGLAVLFGVIYLGCYIAESDAAGSAANVVRQYFRDRSAGICRFIRIQ
jgi:hypothetical protein